MSPAHRRPGHRATCTNDWDQWLFGRWCSCPWEGFGHFLESLFHQGVHASLSRRDGGSSWTGLSAAPLPEPWLQSCWAWHPHPTLPLGAGYSIASYSWQGNGEDHKGSAHLTQRDCGVTVLVMTCIYYAYTN